MVAAAYAMASQGGAVVPDIKVLEFLQKNDKNKPSEDYLQVWQGNDYLVFAVADGVTRYVPEGKSYPDPSHARTAAEIFCSHAVYSLRSCLSVRHAVGDDLMEKAFELANGDIARLNHNLGITSETVDYLEDDYYGCQGAAAAFIPGKDGSKNELLYGYMSDCGLLVFDKDLIPVFISENSISYLERFKEGWGFTNREERRLFWNKMTRNRPNDRHSTFGSLTGEPEALAYLKAGVLNLEPGETGVIFCDGTLPFIYDIRFRETLMRQFHYETSKEEAHAEMARCIDFLTGKLGVKHVPNLNDDKAFVALSLPA